MGAMNDNKSEPKNIVLSKAAGDYVAGDLTPAERAEFEQFLAQDENARKDVAFFGKLQPALAQYKITPSAQQFGTAAEPLTLAQAVHRKIAATHGLSHTEKRLRRIAWSGWLAASAALLMLGVALGREAFAPRPTTTGLFPLGDTVAFLDDGSAVSLPARGALMGPNVARYYQDDYLSTRMPIIYEDARGSAVTPVTNLPAQNKNIKGPTLGVLIQPIALPSKAHPTGLLIVRIAEHSPALQAGLKPGDILVKINDVTLFSRYCIPHCLGELTIGDDIQLTYYRGETLTAHTTKTKLGAYYD
jgi:PDZ domain